MLRTEIFDGYPICVFFVDVINRLLYDGGKIYIINRSVRVCLYPAVVRYKLDRSGRRSGEESSFTAPW